MTALKSPDYLISGALEVGIPSAVHVAVARQSWRKGVRSFRHPASVARVVENLENCKYIYIYTHVSMNLGGGGRRKSASATLIGVPTARRGVNEIVR